MYYLHLGLGLSIKSMKVLTKIAAQGCVCVCICVMAADTGEVFRWRKCAGYHFPFVPAEWEIK